MTDPKEIVSGVVENHIAAITGCMELHGDRIIAVAERMADALTAGNKLMSCGNGGSACDAMHFAGECVGRFVSDRRALPAIALTADPGILTAVGNDYGFDQIFSRQVEAHGVAGDVLVAISTSGQSENVLKAINSAKSKGIYTVLLTGEKGKSVPNVDEIIWVPSVITAHIQETHITALQLIIALIENKIL